MVSIQLDLDAVADMLLDAYKGNEKLNLVNSN